MHNRLRLVAHRHHERGSPGHPHIRAGRLPQGLARLLVNRQNLRLLVMIPLDQQHLAAIDQRGAVSIRVVRPAQVDAPCDFSGVLQRNKIAGAKYGIDLCFIAGRRRGRKTGVVARFWQWRALCFAIRDRHIPQAFACLSIVGYHAARRCVARGQKEALTPDSRTARALKIQRLFPFDVRP